MSRRPELIPRTVRNALRDAMGGWGPYKVDEVAELFEAYNFKPTKGEYDPLPGQRANEAERYQAAIDFTDVASVERYLRLAEEVIEANVGDERSSQRERLQKALKRVGIEPDESGRLQLPKGAAAKVFDPSRVPTDSDIRLHLDRLERLDQEPEELIGAAKDLVEATAKHVLLTLEVTFDRNADVAALSKQALASLGLHPDLIAPTAKGADPMKRILGGLGQIAAGIAELRNMGYGVGHGQGRRVAGLQQRHAEFAARSAIAYVAFVLDTLEDPNAPWRSKQD